MLNIFALMLIFWVLFNNDADMVFIVYTYSSEVNKASRTQVLGCKCGTVFALQYDFLNQKEKKILHVFQQY